METKRKRCERWNGKKPETERDRRREQERLFIK